MQLGRDTVVLKLRYQFGDFNDTERRQEKVTAHFPGRFFCFSMQHFTRSFNFCGCSDRRKNTPHFLTMSIKADIYNLSTTTARPVRIWVHDRVSPKINWKTKLQLRNPHLNNPRIRQFIPKLSWSQKVTENGHMLNFFSICLSLHSNMWPYGK